MYRLPAVNDSVLIYVADIHVITCMSCHQAEPGVQAELVLATLLESQLDKLQQQAHRMAPTTARGRCCWKRLHHHCVFP